jgi:predicted acetylornithine/succinylornithine family transaminase
MKAKPDKEEANMMPDITQLETRTDQIINDEAHYVAQTYKRPPFVLVHGEGVHLYDTEGNAYVDWVAGIAVNALGYKSPVIENALQKQLAHGMLHVSNLYHTAPHVELARMLVQNSFADKVFFCNSGTEANEGAIKFARKVQYEAGRAGKVEIVTFTGGFHGRTMGSLALTPREKYQKPFLPMMPGAVVADFNDIESTKSAIGANTAAVIVEPVQGEGGVNVAEPEFLQALRQLCDAHDALLIFDEVQCGVGRTGTLWAHEASGVTPDIMTLAKPLAGGLPIGAVLMTDTVAGALKPGDHGSTFAGGPVVTGVAEAVLEHINTPDFLTHVQEMGTYLNERLSEINSPLIKSVRGRGLIQALELTIEANKLIEAGYERGLILVNAGPNVLRFVPPLIVETTHIDTLVDNLTEMLADAESGTAQ